MTKLSNLKQAASDAETFVVDRAYFKAQAREALSTFFAPFSGVYAAATREVKAPSLAVKDAAKTDDSPK